MIKTLMACPEEDLLETQSTSCFYIYYAHAFKTLIDPCIPIEFSFMFNETSTDAACTLTQHDALTISMKVDFDESRSR